MNIIKGVANGSKAGSAGVRVAIDADEDLGIFEIGFDVGAIAFWECENYACAPVGALRDAVMHFDDEAGNDTAKQNFVVIFKFESIFPCACVGFFFVKEFGNQVNGFLRIGIEGKTQLEFLHHVENELPIAVFMITIAIAFIFGCENASEVLPVQHSLVFGDQQIVIENAIYATCNPFGIENAGVLQSSIFGEVENDAQQVQKSNQVAAFLAIANFLFGANTFVFGIADMVAVVLFDLFFESKPLLG